MAKLNNPLAGLLGGLKPPGGMTGLSHFTSAGGQAGINSSGMLRGRGGIFALPSSTVNESPLTRGLLRAGISPSSAVHPFPIPAQAQNQFERVLPLGPYSAWKSLGGVRMGPPGQINLTTGAYQPSGSIWNTRRTMYGPDALIYGGLAGTIGAKKWQQNQQHLNQAPSPGNIQ